MATETAVQQDFAVIMTGGKQYIVSAGDVINVELLDDRDLKEGDSVSFAEVLMKNTTVGAPTVAGATVKATYLGNAKGPKISIIRYKAKSNRDRKLGHRQHYAKIKIESI